MVQDWERQQQHRQLNVIPVDEPDGEECGTNLGHDQRTLMRPTEGDGKGTANGDIGAVEYLPVAEQFGLWLPFINR